MKVQLVLAKDSRHDKKTLQEKREMRAWEALHLTCSLRGKRAVVKGIVTLPSDQSNRDKRKREQHKDTNGNKGDKSYLHILCIMIFY